MPCYLQTNLIQVLTQSESHLLPCYLSIQQRMWTFCTSVRGMWLLVVIHLVGITNREVQQCTCTQHKSINESMLALNIMNYEIYAQQLWKALWGVAIEKDFDLGKIEHCSSACCNWEGLHCSLTWLMGYLSNSHGIRVLKVVHIVILWKDFWAIQVQYLSSYSSRGISVQLMIFCTECSTTLLNTCMSILQIFEFEHELYA